MNRQQKRIQDLLNETMGLTIIAVRVINNAMLSIEIGNNWCLELYECSWRINTDGVPFVASEDTPDDIATKSQALVGAKVTECTILNDVLEVEISLYKEQGEFFSFITLTVLGKGEDNTKTWLLAGPNTFAYVNRKDD